MINQGLKHIIRKILHLPKKFGQVPTQGFMGSVNYWDSRYKKGETSGSGSTGALASFKAGVVNSFIKENHIQSVVEFGCGDGNQLLKAIYPSYTGLDVAPPAIEICQRVFKDDKTKSFLLYKPFEFDAMSNNVKAELGLSLDVIYHLVEDDIFQMYMQHLFDAASKYIIVYSSNFDGVSTYHVRHRNFSRWIDAFATGWSRVKEVSNAYPDQSSANFYFYEKENWS